MILRGWKSDLILVLSGMSNFSLNRIFVRWMSFSACHFSVPLGELLFWIEHVGVVAKMILGE